MADKPLISVLVPAYNVEEYIENCIKSIISQTYSNLEILVIDDGSTDRTGEIVDLMATEDERIKVVHKENAGLAATRNRLLDMSEGEYIFQVDADDYISRDAVQILFDNLVKNDAGLSVGSCVCGDEKDYVFDKDDASELEVYSGNDRFRKLFGEDKYLYITAWAKLYEKRLFEGLRYPEGKIHEDEYLAHWIIDRAEKIVRTNTAVYYYTEKKDSISRSFFSYKRLDCVPALLDRNSFFEKKDREDLLRLCYIDFLKRFQYFYYGVKYHYPEEKDLIKRLYDQYKDVYDKASEKKMLGTKEKLMFGLFLKNPWLNYQARKLTGKKAIDT